MARGSGVDVGTSSVKWLSGELKGNTFVVESFVLAENEDGTPAGGWAALAGEKLGRMRVGINGRDLNVRYTRVPRLPDWQLRKLMRFETEEIGGQSDSLVASDFNVLPEMPEVEGEDVVLLALAREALLEEHLEGMASTSGKLDAFTPNALGLYNSFLRFGVIQEENVLLADIGHESLNVVLVRGADLVFARNLSGGSRLFDKALAERFNIDEPRARQYKLTDGTLDTARRSAIRTRRRPRARWPRPPGRSSRSCSRRSCSRRARSSSRRSSWTACWCAVAARACPASCRTSRAGSASRSSSSIRSASSTRRSSIPRRATGSRPTSSRPSPALGLATTAADPDAYGIEILPAAVRKKRQFVGGTLYLVAAGRPGRGLPRPARVALPQRPSATCAWSATACRASIRKWSASTRRRRPCSRRTRASPRRRATCSRSPAPASSSCARSTRWSATCPPTSGSRAWRWSGSSTPTSACRRGNERPILRVKGRSREGTDNPAILFEDFSSALKKRLPEARVKNRMGESDFTLDLCALGEPASAPAPARGAEPAATGPAPTKPKGGAQ
jgi:hypothetical protein